MYLPGIPTGTVQLDQDYLNLQHNFTQLDTTYGVDHYKFSDGTPNNGFHDKVTTPIIVGAAHPLPPADHPLFYGMQDTANVGVIQYSRQSQTGSPLFDVAPSPVTMRQSRDSAITLANNGDTTNIMDFAGLPRAMARLVAASFGSVGPFLFQDCVVYWDGATFEFSVTSNNVLARRTAGSVLILRNETNPNAAINNIYWTLQFYRLQ